MVVEVAIVTLNHSDPALIDKAFINNTQQKKKFLLTYSFISVFILIHMTLFAFYGHNEASTRDLKHTNVYQ